MMTVPSPWSGLPMVLAACALAGWIDLHSKSVIPTAVVLFTASMLISYVWSRQAVFWVVLLGSSIVVSHLIAPRFGIVTPYPVQPIGWDFLLPFIPAAVGAGFGIFAALLTFRGMEQPEEMRPGGVLN